MSTTLADPSNRRIEPRFQATQSQSEIAAINESAGAAVRVEIRWSDDGEQKSVTGELIDLSRKGAKLSVDGPIPIEQKVNIRFRAAVVELDWLVAARICWTTPSDGDDWYIGCALSEEVPEELMAQFARAGLINRRGSRRRLVSIPAVARCELDGDEGIEVCVKDFSTGGFRIFSPRTRRVGERLLLRVPLADGNSANLAGRILWQVETDDGYMVGCSFLSPGAFDVLDRVAGEVEPADRGDDRRSLRLQRWTWFGMLAVILWFGMWTVLDLLR